MFEPSISVVITSSRDEPKKISGCLNSIYSGSLSKNFFEVIVVDSGAGEEVKDYLKSLKNQYSNLNLLFPELGNIGPARARNLGVLHARSPLIAFTDDDIVVHPEWLKTLTESFCRYPEVAGVGGMYLPQPIYKGNIFAEHEVYIYLSYRRKGKSESYLSTTRDEHPVFTGNMAYRKDIFTRVGGFREDFPPFVYGEDGDLKERVLKLGYPFLYVDLVNGHDTEYTFSSFWRKEENRGAGILRFLRNHQKLFPSRLKIVLKILSSPLFFLYILVTPLKCKVSHPISVKILLVLAYVARQTGKLRYYDKA